MITHFPTTGASDLLLGILDGSPNGIVAYQPIRNEAGIIIDYETVYYNAQARMLLGYTDTDFRQGTLFQRFPAARALETAYMPLIQNNQPFIHESYFKRAGRWVQTQARRLGDGFFLIFSDITTRKEAEVSLIHRNQLLDGVINTFLSGITAFEPIMNDAGEVIDFRVTLVNDGALLLLGGGYTREQLLGNTLIQLYPETQEQGCFTII